MTLDDDSCRHENSTNLRQNNNSQRPTDLIIFAFLLTHYLPVGSVKFLSAVTLWSLT